MNSPSTKPPVAEKGSSAATVPPASSLVRTTMLQMALRISLIIVIASGITYYKLMDSLETETREHLKLFIEQRVDIESQWLDFLSLRMKQLRAEYIERYQRMKGVEPPGDFDRYFQMNDDGTAYPKREYYEGIEGSLGVLFKGFSGGIDNAYPLTPDRRLRLVLAMQMLLQHGSSFVQPAMDGQQPLAPFVDFYIETPEKDLLVYWPGTPWYPDYKGGYDIATQGDFSKIFDQKIPYFQREHSWTGTYRDDVPKVWMVSYTMPIELNGKSIAGLGVDISLSAINKRLTQYRFPGTTSLIIRDDGRLIAQPLLEKEMIARKGEFYLEKDGDEAMRELYRLVAANPGQAIIDDVVHDRLLAVGRIAGPGWLFITEYPKSLMASAATNTVLFIFALGLLSLLLEVGMLWRVMRKQVSQPLSLFARAAEAIGNGDFSETSQLPVARHDELGRLAKVFRDMTQSLRIAKDNLLDDISRRETIEKKLINRTERLDEAQRIARIGNWELDHATNDLQWSDEIYRIFEKDKATFLPGYESGEQLVHPDDREEMNQTYKESVEAHLPYEHTHRLLMADGRIKWVHVRGETFYNEENLPVVSRGIIQDVTAQKLQDEELEKHRNYLEQLVQERTSEVRTYAALQNAFLENASALVVILDKEGRICQFNRAAEILSGYTVDEVKGQVFSDILLPPEEAEKTLAEAFEALAKNPQQQKGNYRNHWLSKSGEKFLTEWNNSLLLDADGNMQFMVAIGVDITERQRSEEAILNSTKRLNEAQRIARVGSWELDLVTQELIWSDEIFRLFEIDKDSFGASYDAFLAAIHPEDREAVDSAYSKSLDLHEPYEIVHRLLMSDGRIKWVHECCETQYDQKGRALVSKGTVQDITAQKLLDEELRQHRQYLEQLVSERTAALESASFAKAELAVNIARLKEAQRVAKVGSWEFDLNSGSLYWSEEMYRLHGLDPRQGPPDYDTNMKFYNTRSAAQFCEAMERVLAQGTSFELELCMNPVNANSSRWVYSICNAHKDAQGKVSGLSGTVQDITAQKHLDNELQKHRDYLEQLVQERTFELEKAKEQSEQANKAKSQFLSNMSHELRTPMNAILGFTQLLEMSEKLDNQQQDYVHEILNGGTHLLELINEVLDLARIESGKLDLQLVPVNLAEIVEECFSLMKPLASKKSIDMTHDELGRINVVSDPVRLRQVLLNILGNAIKYNSERGKVTLRLTLLGNERLCISIVDTGWGIDQDNIGQIFEPFYRIHNGHSDVEGTGIGLAITRNLVELMGGKISVESRLGMGSCFSIELQLAPASLDIAGVDKYENVMRDKLQGHDCQKVLYIEDNPANLKLVSHILADQSHIQLITAHDALLGLDLAISHEPALILLDINMPHLDGYKVLGILQQDERLKTIPVIAITANAMKQDIERGKKAGFSDYLTKPLDVKRFIQVINACLGR